MGIGKAITGKSVDPGRMKKARKKTAEKPAPKKTTKKREPRAEIKIAPILIDKITDVITEPDDFAAAYPNTIRASAAGDYCPRAEILARFDGQEEEATTLATGRSIFDADTIPLRMAHTFMIGKAVHEFMQNEVLGRQSGVLQGHWICEGCEAEWGGNDPSEWVPNPEYVFRETEEWPKWSKPPEYGIKKACQHHTVKLQEAVMFDPATNTSGHIDGEVLDHKGDMIGLEIKTISAKEFPKLKRPKTVQTKQATVYVNGFKLKRIIFMYVSKGWCPTGEFPRARLGSGWQHSGFKEFVFEADHRFVTKLLRDRESVLHSMAILEDGVEDIEDLELPDRLSSCDDPEKSRCRACAVADLCWSTDG